MHEGPSRDWNNPLLADFFEALSTWAEQAVEVLGLPGITLLALFENLFPPTPSEFLYPLAGKLAYDGAFTVWGVIVAGVIGSLAGSLAYYTLGYRLGEARARQLIVRFGQVKLAGFRIQITSAEDYDRALLLFRQRGGIIVLVARLMPLVHSVVSIPAGVARMSLRSFIAYTAVGSALWIAPLTILGWWLGSNWERILYWMDIYEYAWYALMGLAAAVFMVRRVRGRRRGEPVSHPE